MLQATSAAHHSICYEFLSWLVRQNCDLTRPQSTRPSKPYRLILKFAWFLLSLFLLADSRLLTLEIFVEKCRGYMTAACVVIRFTNLFFFLGTDQQAVVGLYSLRLASKRKNRNCKLSCGNAWTIYIFYRWTFFAY